MSLSRYFTPWPTCVFSPGVSRPWARAYFCSKKGKFNVGRNFGLQISRTYVIWHIFVWDFPHYVNPRDIYLIICQREQRLGSTSKRLSVFERRPLDVWLLLLGVVFLANFGLFLRFGGSLKPLVLVFFRHSLPYLFFTRHLL